MIQRCCLNNSSDRKGISLTPVSIDRRFRLMHNSFIMGWVRGILVLVFRLICSLKISKYTSKEISSNSKIEGLWLITPIFVLTSVGVRTTINLNQLDSYPISTNHRLKSTGRQWYWNYEILGNTRKFENEITRYMEETNNDRLNYLSREQELSLAMDCEYVNLISATDVMHSWALPTLMIKADAIPGRVNILRMDLRGLIAREKYYGQCSELCGANHRFMPISVAVY